MTTALDRAKLARELSDAPKTIYLQWDGREGDDATWCVDQINDDDIMYIRADIAQDALRNQTAETIGMMAERNGLRHVEDTLAADVETLAAENAELRARLERAEAALEKIATLPPEQDNDTLQAIRHIGKMVAIANAALNREGAK